MEKKMALSEKTIIERIEIDADGVVRVRYANIIERDGVEAAKTYLRETFVPGQDVSEKEQQIREICATAWTAQVIQDYKDMMAAAKAARDKLAAQQAINEA
jgi:uncharacterized protein YchJ